MNINNLLNRGLLKISPYVFGKPGKEVEGKYGVQKIIKMNSNENALGPSPVGIEYTAKILSKSNLYPESTNRALREKIAEIFQLKPDNIIVGNGASEIIYYAAIGFVNDNDEVIIPEVTYPLYQVAFNMMRANIVTCPMNVYKIDLNGIIKRITEKTKAVVICNPNNPTGHAIKKNAMYDFLKRLPDNLLVVLDEAYCEFADIEEFPDSITMFKKGCRNILIIRTLSKAYGLAGLRVGYAIGDENIVDVMNRIKLPFNISLISQHAALGALEDKEFLWKTIESVKNERNAIFKALVKLGLSYVKSSTNFILVNVGKDSDYVSKELEKRGIMVRNAKPYGAPTSIRITVGTKNQNNELIKALKEILKKNG